MLKVLGVIVAILVASIVVIVGVGYALPVKHVVARSITLRRKPEEVFALISDVKNGAAWRSDVKEVEMLPDQDGRTRYREKMQNGAVTMELVSSDPPRRILTEIADKSLPFGGAWIFEIFPTEDGCRLSITERGEVYNPVFRFVSRYIMGHTATMDAYLKNVARKFGESAEPVTSQPAAP